MINPVIDRAGVEDIEQLLPLLEALFSLEQDFTFNADNARYALDRLIEDKNRGCVLVARNDQRIIGMCTAQLVISSARGAPSAWIEDVVVERAHQGQGVGDLMLRELERWCREQGARRMQLVADRDNAAAREFYHHTGWNKTNLNVLKKEIKT